MNCIGHLAMSGAVIDATGGLPDQTFFLQGDKYRT